MGNSEEMEELWIHGALNARFNDQSQLAEIEAERKEMAEERKGESDR